MLSARSLEPTTKRVRLAPQTNGERVRGIFQLPKFSVIVWVRKTDEFEAIRNDLVSLVGDEPFESTEYEGTVDLHWGFKEHAEAKQVAESLREISQKPEIVLLRVSSLDDAIASFSLKDERRTALVNARKTGRDASEPQAAPAHGLVTDLLGSEPDQALARAF